MSNFLILTKSILILMFGILLVENRSVCAEQVNREQIDLIVNQTISAFQVPGAAIAIVKDGKTIHLKGYGVSNLDTNEPVNEKTVFKIASNTKAFTTAALAVLVERKKLNWDDKVVKYLPNFKMYDPWVSKEFNVRDLLVHRSGLRIGAGDLMLWPEPTKFTRQDVIENLRHLKPVAGFRDEYAYDNLLYIVAGELIAKVSGMSWETFVELQLFTPLQMERCFAGGIATENQTNIAAPHAIVENKLIVLDKYVINNKTSLMAAAGGIKCSAEDLAKWVKLQLNQGKINAKNKLVSKRLFSKEQSDILWKPVTTLPLSDELRQLDKTTYRSYALGWRISDFFGYRSVSHTGMLGGFMSQIILLPELNVGIVILTNQQSSDARNSLARGLLQKFVPQANNPANVSGTKVDWVKYYSKEREIKNSTKKKDITSDNNYQEIKIDTEQLLTDRLGQYKDVWFGDVVLEKVGIDIVFRSIKSPRMIGKIYAHDSNRWWVKWDDRSFDADAWLNFKLNDVTNKTEFSMKAISSETDFSFDFEDLYFIKK